MSGGMITAKFDGGPFHGQTMIVPDREVIELPYAEPEDTVPLHKMGATAKGRTYTVALYRRSYRTSSSVPGGVVVFYYQEEKE